MQPIDLSAITPLASVLFIAVIAVAVVTGLREVVCGLRARSMAAMHLASSADARLSSAVAAWESAPGDLVAFELLAREVRRVLSTLPARTMARLASGIDQWNRTGRTRYVAALVAGVPRGPEGVVDHAGGRLPSEHEAGMA